MHRDQKAGHTRWEEVRTDHSSGSREEARGAAGETVAGISLLLKEETNTPPGWTQGHHVTAGRGGPAHGLGVGTHGTRGLKNERH